MTWFGARHLGLVESSLRCSIQATAIVAIVNTVARRVVIASVGRCSKHASLSARALMGQNKLASPKGRIRFALSNCGTSQAQATRALQDLPACWPALFIAVAVLGIINGWHWQHLRRCEMSDILATQIGVVNSARILSLPLVHKVALGRCTNTRVGLRFFLRWPGAQRDLLTASNTDFGAGLRYVCR